MPQRFVVHDRSEIGATDADIDDIANALAGVTFPRSAAHSSGEIGHFVEDGVHVGYDVSSVKHNGCATWRAERDVQHRAFFGDVDYVAAEHGGDARLEAAFSSELLQQRQRFVGHSVLGIVEIKAGRIDGEPFAAAGIVGKELPQVDVF